MKLIPLTQGQFAIVDDADYDWLNQHKWYVSAKGYAVRKSLRNNGRQSNIWMHREITRASAGLKVDHVDLNKLNNRRENLRFTSHSGNMANREKLRTNTSGFKGVSFHKHTSKWRASIYVDGKHRSLGLFFDPVKAAQAYDAAHVSIHGPFARPNFQ